MGRASAALSWCLRPARPLDPPGWRLQSVRLTAPERRATVHTMPNRGFIGGAAAAVCLLCALALASCSVSQTLVISADGSGSLATRVEVSPLLRDYLASLADISGNPGPLKEGRVFDAAAIRKDFQSRPGIVVQKAATPTSSSLDLELGFDSLKDVMRSQDGLAVPARWSWVTRVTAGPCGCTSIERHGASLPRSLPR